MEFQCTLEVVDAETNCLRNLQQQLNVKLAMTLAKNWITSSGTFAIITFIANCTFFF